MSSAAPLPPDLASTVRRALSEDIGSGDLTAALIDAHLPAAATVTCREPAILCGAPWFDEVYRQLGAGVAVDWLYGEGAAIAPDTLVCRLQGPARALLSGERTALNFLQLLSGTATTTHLYARILQGTRTRLLDTRKTLPGLRSAQKYAVQCGGGYNHRMGLYDAILIKENHILAAGGLGVAVQRALGSQRNVQVEVESIDQLLQAIDAGAHAVLLDNFPLSMLHEAVALNGGRLRLEVSGGIDEDRLADIAATGVDYVSVGALTKHVHAIDYSMRFTPSRP